MYTDLKELKLFFFGIYSVDSIAEIWAPLLMGVPLLIVPKDMTTNTECFISLLDRCGVSRLVLVPSLLKAMLSLITSRSQLNGRLCRLFFMECNKKEIHCDVKNLFLTK